MNDHTELPPPVTPLPGGVQATVNATRGPAGTLSWLANNFEEVVTALLLGVMIVSVGLSVFFRYVLQKPFSWTEEVVRPARQRCRHSRRHRRPAGRSGP